MHDNQCAYLLWVSAPSNGMVPNSRPILLDSFASHASKVSNVETYRLIEAAPGLSFHAQE